MKDFFAKLNKSSKITMISCACFIGLTVLILGFFVMFPITPSEKVIASIGRESINRDNDQNSAVTTTAAAATNADDVLITGVHTTTSSKTSRTEFTIVVTSGSGFFAGGYIPTGMYPYEGESVPTTTTESEFHGGEYEEPTGYEEPTTTENPNPTEEPVTEPPTPPVTSEQPPVTTAAPPDVGGNDTPDGEASE